MRKKKGEGESPSSPQPRFVIEDGEAIEVAAAKEVFNRKQAAKHRPPPPKLMPVTLQMRHSINGKFYGPGTLMLTEKEAQRFLNVEYEAMLKEDSLTRQQAFIISMHNGVPVRREVPTEQFDNILMREELPVGNMPSGRR